MRIVQVADRNETTLQHLAATLPRLHEPLGGVLGDPRAGGRGRRGLHDLPPRLGRRADRAALRRAAGVRRRGRAPRGTQRSSSFRPRRWRSSPSVPRALGPAHDRLLRRSFSRWRRSRRGGRAAGRGAAGVGNGAGPPAAPRLRHEVAGVMAAPDRADAPLPLVDLGPAGELLEAYGVRRAYASYGPAFRLTWESARARWSPRRPGTTASATGRCRCSTRSVSRRTSRGY